MSAEREPENSPQDHGHNPTAEELDVEGPNESAPGHEPSDPAGESEEPGSASSEGGAG